MNSAAPAYVHRLLVLLCCAVLSTTTYAYTAPLPQQLIVRTPVIPPRPVLSQTTRTWLEQRQYIRVAVWGTIAYPPFDMLYQADGFEGLSADYLGVLQQSLNMRLVLERYPDRQAAEQALLRDEVDLLALFTNDAPPLPGVLASEPYLLDRAVILRRTNDAVDVSGELAGLNIAIAADDDVVNRVQAQYPHARLIRTAGQQNAIAALVYGQADVLWSDAASAEYLAKRAYFNRTVVAGESRSPDFNISFAVNAANLPLLDGVNLTLKAIPLAGRLRIASRWRLGTRYTQMENPLALTPAEQRWIAQHDVLRVVVVGSFAPLTFFDKSGVFHGITADILQRVEQRTGLTTRIIRSDTLENMEDRLENAEADVVGSLSVSDERTDKLLFTRPYLVSPFVVVTRFDIPALMDITGLNDKKLAIPSDNPLIPWLREHYPTIHLVITDNATQGIELLGEGQVYGSVHTQISADYFIQHFFQQKLRINTNIGPQGAHIAMATRQDQPIIQSILDKALLDIPPEELARLVDSWRSHSTPATASSWSNYKDFVYKAIGAALLGMLIFLLWNSYLRKQINERRKAERALNDQLEFSRTLIDGSPVALYVRDSIGQLLQCNQAYLDFLKVQAHQVLGKRLDESPVMTPEFNERYQALYAKTMIDGQPSFADLEIKVQGEALRIYHWTLPFQNGDGHLIGVIGGWVDITERERLMHQVREAKNIADSANRSKSVFLASMSHEIRTPMNAIIGLLELLQRRGGTPQQTQESLALAHESAQSLLSLIGDILDLSKIESGAMAVSARPTHLTQLLQKQFDLFKISARQKGLDANLIIELNHDKVLVDPLMLRQIVSNLLSNAIKFTEFGHIELALFEDPSPAVEGISRFSLQVTDTGIGMDREQQQAVYEPFVQTCDENMAQGGSGLGLSICRRLAALMNAQLVLESQPGIGSTFSLSFSAPLCDESEVLRLEKPETHFLQPLNVLIADDHAANRLLLAQQLEFLGHQVETAEDGTSALELWTNAELPYDLLITDCDMPKMDGFALVRRIRQLEQEQRHHASVLFGLTANAQMEIIEQCVAAGMTDCLFKPLSLDSLGTRLAQAFPQLAGTTASQAPKSTERYDPTISISFIKQVLDCNRLDAQALETATNKGDIEALTKLAHRIKGAAKYVEAQVVISACECLELAISQHRHDSISVHVKGLIQAMKQLEHLLEAKLMHHEQILHPVPTGQAR